MSRTSFFSGGNESGTHQERSRKVARALSSKHPELSHGLLYSACSYLLRGGYRLHDSDVVIEARRRKRMLDQAVESRRRRFRKDAAA